MSKRPPRRNLAIAGRGEGIAAEQCVAAHHAMKILALETSTEYCFRRALAGRSGDRHKRKMGQRHSEVLMAMLDGVLVEAGVNSHSWMAIAFGAGARFLYQVFALPGGVTQGLALGCQSDCHRHRTMHAVAQASGKNKVIVASMRAWQKCILRCN